MGLRQDRLNKVEIHQEKDPLWGYKRTNLLYRANLSESFAISLCFQKVGTNIEYKSSVNLNKVTAIL